MLPQAIPPTSSADCYTIRHSKLYRQREHSTSPVDPTTSIKQQQFGHSLILPPSFKPSIIFPSTATSTNLLIFSLAYSSHVLPSCQSTSQVAQLSARHFLHVNKFSGAGQSGAAGLGAICCCPESQAGFKHHRQSGFLSLKMRSEICQIRV